jgi:hypothetical protein
MVSLRKQKSEFNELDWGGRCSIGTMSLSEKSLEKEILGLAQESSKHNSLAIT